MVSLQESISPRRSGELIQLELDSLSSKRKWNNSELFDRSEGIFGKRVRSTETVRPVFEVELQLETPLPLEWQRCLDIQSGKIHFYNTRTQKRTSMDPRTTPSQKEPTENDTMSLELQLNLPCDSHRKKNKSDFLGLKDESRISNEEIKDNLLEFEENNGEEMVAIVCEKCHLLVMLCKSSPSCPNCKFMHSTHQNFCNNFNQQTLLPSCATYL